MIIFLSSEVFIRNEMDWLIKVISVTQKKLRLDSFVFVTVVHILWYGFQIGQIKENLMEFDENGQDELTIMRFNKQRRFVLLIFIALITGLRLT